MTSLSSPDSSKDNPAQKRPVLYSFRRCPYAIRARMALYYAGITAELREVDLKNKPAAMLEASPKGTVPVLALPGGTVIDESLDIMHWALAQNDPEGWLAADSEETAFLITRNDSDFKNALDRYKYPGRFPDEDCRRARRDCETILKDLDNRMKENGFLLAGRATLVDVALFPFIRQCAFTDKEWFDALPFPHLQNRLAEHLDSALFQAVMEKYEVWDEQAAQPAPLFGPDSGRQ